MMDFERLPCIFVVGLNDLDGKVTMKQGDVFVDASDMGW